MTGNVIKNDLIVSSKSMMSSHSFHTTSTYPSTVPDSTSPHGTEQGGGNENLATLGFILPMTAAILFDLIVIAGNSLVIAAVFTHKRQLLTVTNTFIVSLAAADLLLGLVVLPFSSANEVLGRWPFGDTWCTGWLVLDVWLCTASILNLCAISIDRYLAISRPFRYPTMMSPGNAKILVAFVWILALAICVPPLFGWKDPSPILNSILSNDTLLENQFNHSNSIYPSNSNNIVHTSPAVSAVRTQTAGDIKRPVDLEWYLLGSTSMDNNLRVSAGGDQTSFTKRETLSSLQYNYVTDERSDESKLKQSGNLQAAKPPVEKNRVNPTSHTMSSQKECALTSEPGYVIYSACGSFWIPMFVMLFFYVRIYRTAAKATEALRRGVVTRRIMTSSSSLDSAVNLRVHRGGGAASGGGYRGSTGSWLDGGEVLPSQRFRLQQLVAQTAPRGYSTAPATPEPSSRNNCVLNNLNDVSSKRPSGISRFFMRSWSRDSIISGSDVRAFSYSTSRDIISSHDDINDVTFVNAARRNNGIDYRQGSAGCATVCEEIPSNESVAPTVASTTALLTARRTTGTGGGGGLLQVRTQLRRLNREKRAAKTVGIIVGCFVLCWAPFFSVYLLGAFCPDCTPRAIFIIVFWLGYCNSAVNPFIYAMCSNDFRRAFQRLLLCRWGRRRRNRTQLAMLITGLRAQQSTNPPDRRISDILSVL